MSSLECKFCNKTYSSISSLNYHQKTARCCILIQQKGNNDVKRMTFGCEYCNKQFSSKQRLKIHSENCIDKYKKIIQELKDNIEKNNLEHQLIISEKNIKIKEIEDEKLFIDDKLYKTQVENKILKQNIPNLDSQTQKHLVELQSKLQEIALAAIEQKNEVITSMVKKYVKKQPRKHFDCSNVIYILTTPSLKKDRRYILGKAKNLTNRLSTYNKSDEHEVIFYQDCGDEEAMNALEPFVFKKLNEYREQANRERFILPKDKHIDFFKDTITNCFEFLK